MISWEMWDPAVHYDSQILEIDEVDKETLPDYVLDNQDSYQVYRTKGRDHIFYQDI